MRFPALIALALAALLLPQTALAADMKAGCVVEQQSGRVLYAYNAETRLPPASCTKIATALTVLSLCEPTQVVTVGAESVGVEGSSIYLEKGETFTVEQLLYGLMLRSGNDAADALARAAAGSLEDFAACMNAAVQVAGAENTHFTNPHGLPDEAHYSTAKDLCLIAARAYESDLFRQIVSTRRTCIPWKGRAYDRVLTNENKMLYLCEGGNGVKTGFTKKAGRCLVSGAERGGMQLIACVLGCPDMWTVSCGLLDEAFASYEMVEVVDGLLPLCYLPLSDRDETVAVLPARDVALPLTPDEGVKVALHLPETLTPPLARGQELGYATLIVSESEAWTLPLLCARDVSPLSPWQKFCRWLSGAA